MVRTKRRKALTDTEAKAIIRAARKLDAALCATLPHLGSGDSSHRKAVESAREAIGDLMEIVTGDRNHLYANQEAGCGMSNNPRWGE